MHININVQGLGQIDLIADKIPVLSTVTNIVYLFFKCAILPFIKEEAILENRYFTYIQEKNILNCVCLLIPIFGNLINWAIVKNLTKKGEDLFKQFLDNSKENPTLALSSLREAAKLKNPNAMAELGLSYMKGSGIERDPKKAFKLFHQAAMQNLPRALYCLHLCYRKGDGTSKDEAKARYYLTESALNDPYAKSILGTYYLKGEMGFVEDKEKAFKLFLEGAKEKVPEALSGLRECYQYGIGTQINLLKARECLQDEFKYKAVSSEILNQIEKEERKQYEDLILQDPANRLKYVQDAAKKGNSSALIDLGQYYLKGEQGLNREELKAFECFNKSANQNHPAGMHRLANCYFSAKGTPQNQPQGRKWLMASAHLNHRPALNELGRCYLAGAYGFDINEIKAFELFQRAAKLKDGLGVYNLSLCYLYGKGTEMNKQKALTGLQVAAKYFPQSAVELARIQQEERLALGKAH